MPKVKDREIRALGTEFYEKRLFIFLSKRKELRRHNIMETRHACGTSRYQICYFNRTS